MRTVKQLVKQAAVTTATVALGMTLVSTSAQAQNQEQARVTNVVIVHGALVDGSGWRDVYELLIRDGFKVTIVQEPLTSLADDVAATKRILDFEDGPTILVGQSYGGTVITQAGTDPKVKALVYVSATAPEVGESTAQLVMSIPPASNNIHPTADGFLFENPADFAADFAADVPNKASVEFMAHSQAFVAATAFAAPVSEAAWHNKPSYGVVPTEDRIINPELERKMYRRAGAKVTEVKGASHSVFVSQPRVVADVIEEAARDTN
ncbi:alpha/beta fold hydrolase [Edaphobacter aggregans]|uniref:alpha/beta fold hydrolase n=1 Tax=Edaphobacter aggregans TaxID=570835 RepID=UPI00054E91D4|nr:alpha/beta hydrolase [Edaphobacter aggregans]